MAQEKKTQTIILYQKKIPSKLNRSDILDRDGNYLSKTVNSIDIGISPSKIIDEKKIIIKFEIYFPK